MGESSLKIDYEPLGAPKRSEKRSQRGFLARAVRFVLGLLALVLLPFVVLVRLSVSAYHNADVGAWAALGLGALATVLLLVLYLWVARIVVQSRWTLPRVVWVPVVGIVASYLIYALVYLSSVNAKSGEVQAYYHSLHPLLRVATSTVFLIDRDAVITDIGRTRQDYLDWGLSVNETSLHFEQPDGFVHALDLRTRGRPEWRNQLQKAYFWSMGFYTLRHTGTADHLHVSLRGRAGR